jgi:hypothetical protein
MTQEKENKMFHFLKFVPLSKQNVSSNEAIKTILHLQVLIQWTFSKGLNNMII